MDTNSRHEQRLRRKAAKCLQKQSSKEIAQDMARHTARRIWRQVLQQDGDEDAAIVNPTLIVPMMVENDELVAQRIRQHDSDSVSTEYSSERAVKRGLRRGASELNEVGSVGQSTVSDIDLHTVAAHTQQTSDTTHSKDSRKNTKAAWTSNGGGGGGGSGVVPRNSNKKKPRKKVKKDPNEAWMCGVCGMAFATLEFAEKHESEHILQIVSDLGWAPSSSVGAHYAPNGFLWSPISSAPAVLTPASLTSPLGLAENSNGTIQRPPRPSSFTSRTTSEQTQKHANTTTRIAAPKASARREHAQSDFFRLGDIQEDQALEDDHRLLEPYDEDEANDNSSALLEPNLIRVNHHASGLAHREQTVLPDELDTPLPHSMLLHDDHGGDVFRNDGLPEGALIPQPRPRPTKSALRKGTAPPVGLYHDHRSYGNSLLLTSTLQDYVVVADEALRDVCHKAEPLILTATERAAERELGWLARDKQFYHDIAERAIKRQYNPSNRFRSDNEGMLGKVQNKLLDAYQLMKESDGQRGLTDEYNRKKKGEQDGSKDIVHSAQTLYVNVIVKNSIQVVKHELERLAQQRWEKVEDMDKFTRFERFRVYAHMNIVRLAGIALASDFTPRRIAVQLSNDLYRLLTPRLKKRGVTIATEIEYRVGPFFVIATNINNIDWGRLIKATYRDVTVRRARWATESRKKRRDGQERKTKKGGENVEDGKKSVWLSWREWVRALFNTSQFDILAQIFAWLYLFHWCVYYPICWIAYRDLVLGHTIRQFIISSVTDEIFYYVEQKGMEMEIDIRNATTQAAFMLAALREIRADGRELEKKRKESETDDKGVILGPLLGPAIKADKEPAVKPEGFDVPDNLEYVGLELEVPVGFRRLRWAMLSSKSDFIKEAIYRAEAKYDNITVGTWNRHDEHIGSANPPVDVDQSAFIGAEKEGSYLMPKSVFTNANMCSETHEIVAYNDYCFTLKKKALTPDVPYGSTFVAWTQFTVINLGNESSKLIFSVEPEFPNGPPLVSRQITSGMRSGVGQLFVLIGTTITKYADEYP